MESPALELPAAGEWLKALLIQLVDRAAFDLEDLQANPELALHRLRLRMKKAEAMLQLSKGALRTVPRGRLKKQIKSIKNAGARQRDNEVLGRVAKKIGEPMGLHLAMPPDRHSQPDMKHMEQMLGKLRRELSETLLDDLRWADVEDNYRGCYRSGRRRMRKASQSLDSADFHKWRKRVKALQYQSQALAPALKHVRRRLKQARNLGKDLGREHDLTLLEQRTAQTAQHGLWSEVITTHREKLRRRILDRAGELYCQPAHRFARVRRIPV